MRKASEGVQFRRSARVGKILPLFRAFRLSVKHLLLATLLTLGVVFSFAPSGNAPTRVEAATGVNDQINFQARILSDQGSLVADGDYNVRFRIYQDGDGVLGGGDETLVWTEEYYDSNGVTAGNDNRVRVVNGYISVQLNELCGSFTSGGCISNGGVDFNQDTLWLSIDIGGTTQTATPTYDGEMDPFIRFTSVPYALNSDAIDGLDSTDLVQLGQGEQAVNTAGTGTNAAISVDQTGAGDLLNLQVSNATVLNLSNAGNLTVSGTAAFQGASISVGEASTTTGQLVFYDSNSANTLTLTAGDMTGGGLTLTLPTADGGNGDCLVTDGSGALSFSNTCGGGGSGLFSETGGSPNFTYLTDTASDWGLGANTAANAALFFDTSAYTLFIGTDDTANGILTLYSSGVGVTDPTISANATGDLTLSAPDGTVVVGSGSGNIALSLSNPSDLLIADKTATITAAYAEDDFTFTRDLTNSVNTQSMGGSILNVTDTSTAVAGTTIDYDLIFGNANPSQTFTGNLLRLQTGGVDQFTVDASGNLVALGNIDSDNGSIMTNGTARINNSGDLVNIGNLTAAGSLVISSTGGGNNITLTPNNNLILSTLTSCTALTTDGSGVVSCGSGGSIDNLDDAYNNFGANPALVTIDAAESQTGGLEFALNTTDNFTIDLQNTGDFVLQDNNSTFLTVSDIGSFDYTLDATDNPTFTVTNQGSGNVTYNLAGTGDFVIQDNGTPVFTVSDDGNVAVANDLTVSGNLDLGFTQGSIPFQGASGLTENNGQLFWDNTNNKLGLGTATPHADGFGGLELVISDGVAGTTAGISLQSGASLETQAIFRANDSNGYTELATLGSGNALLLYTNGATRAIFPSTGNFVVGGTLTDGAFGTIEARGSTSASLAVNPRTAGGTGDLVFYEADTAQTGFRYDGLTNTTYFRDFANSANRITFTQAGDIYVSADGGTTGTPRTMAFNNLTAGEAVRFQFGDPYSAFQNQFGGSLDIYAYHTIRLAGDRNAASGLTFSTESNIGTHVINTIAASEALVVSGAASQSADLFVVENSAGTNLFEINSDGTFSFNTSVYDCSGSGNGGVLTVNASGDVICDADDGGVGSGGVDSVNSLNGSLTLQGTASQITVTDNGSDTITLSLPNTVVLGDTTNAGILELNDSSANAYQTILQSADLTTFAGDLTLTLPGDAGNSGQCLKTDGSGVLSFSNCNNGSGSGGAITLQDAYEAGNFITTDDGGTYGDIQFTLADTATDRNFTITTATGAGGYTYISRADGAGTVDPNQLLLVEDLDVNRTIADGIKVQAAFGITDGLDVSDAELTNAINIGANAIAGTNFSVTGAGAITSVGLNAGTGLIQGTGGLTIGGTITFSSLTGCDTIDTDGSGVLSCGTDASGGGGAPTDAQYLVLSLDGGLSAERLLNPGTSLTVTDNGANGNYDINTIQDIRTSASPTFASPTFSGTLAVQGSSVTIGTASTTNGSLVFLNSTNANTVTVQSGATSTGYTLTLPTAVGGANECLQNSGTPGILTFSSCGGGAFTSSGGLTELVTSTDTVTIGSSTAGAKLFVDGDADEVQLEIEANGTQTANVLEVSTNGGTGDMFVIRADGRVGIGDSGPDALFDIGSTYTTTRDLVQIGGTVDFGTDNIAAVNIGTVLDAGNTFNATGLVVDPDLVLDSGETIANYYGIDVGIPSISGTGTLTNATGIFIRDIGTPATNNNYSLLVGGDARFNDKLAVNDNPNTAGAWLTTLNSNGEGLIALEVIQQDTTNNPVALNITNAGTGNSIQINTNDFVVDSTGNLNSAGTGTFSGASVTVGTASTTNGALILQNATNGFTVSVNAPSQTTGSATISFPDTAGANDTFCLVTLANCGGGGSLFTETGGSPNLTYLTDTASDFAIGGTSSAAASFFFDESLGQLSIGTNESLNGQITLQSSGVSITDPTIAVNASGDLTLSAPSGTVVVGSGSGNIELQLDNAADLLIADKTASLSGAYSSDSFTISQTLTGGANNIGGSVLTVTDTSTSSGTMNYDLIFGNAAPGSGTFTGNLLRLQSGGTDRFIVAEDGSIDLTNTSIYDCNGLGNGGKLTVDGSGNVVCAADTGGGSGAFTSAAGLTELTTSTDTVTIGSSTAGGKLFVDGDADEVQLQVQANATQTNNLAVFENSAGNPLITFDGSGGAIFNEQGNDADFRVESDTVPGALFVQGSDGFVGIGTQTPAFKLNVVSDGAASFISNDAYGDGTAFQGRRANGTVSLPTALGSADLITQLSGRGYGATGFSGTRVSVGLYASQNWTDAAQGSRIDFFTTADDTTTLTRRLRIDNDGRVIISNASPTTNSKLIVENNYASGTASALEQGIQVNVGNTGSATVTDLKGIQTNLVNTGGGTVDYAYGIYLGGTTNTGSTITNLYGLYISDQSLAGAANDFNIYSQGANSINYLQGSTGIGDDTPDAKLDVQIGTNTDVGLIVQGAASQSGDYIQVLDSAGTTEYFSIDGSGNIFFTQLDCSALSNGGALTADTNGQISCSADDGGGSATNLDDAYNNFAATASKINVDSAEGQTGGLEFELTGTNDFIVDMQGTGSFQIQDGGNVALYVSQDNGKVGIGTTTTNALLHLNAGATFTDNPHLVRFDGILDSGVSASSGTALVIATDLDVADTQNAYGIDIQQGLTLDSGETTQSYRGIYVRPPTVAGAGTLSDAYGLYLADYDSVGASGDNYSIRVEGQSQFIKQVGVGGGPISGYMLGVDTDPGQNLGGIRIQQQDTTNNPEGLRITNAGTGNYIRFDDGTDAALRLTYDGVLAIGDNNFSNAELRIYDGDATANYVGLKSRAALASNYTLTLPSTAPGINECLKAGGTTATDLVFGSCGSGSGAFTSSGGLTQLSTTTDTVTIGSGTAGAKLFVDGDADEVQLNIEANATQTADLLQVSTNGGGAGDLLSLDSAGNLYAGGDISIDETDQLILDAATAANTYIQANDNGIEFISDGVQVLKARNTGRVGIGTFNPQGRLEVDVADTNNVPALILDMNDVTNNPDVLVIENAGTGNSIEIDTTDFIVDSTGNVQAAGNINANGGSLQTNGVARVDNSGNLVNIGNLTASGAITISSTGAGNDIILSAVDQITLSGFNCSTFTNGGALTTDASGNIACSNDDGGGSGAFTSSGGLTQLSTTTDTVTIGSGTAGAKLFVDGDADEVQLEVEANASQTADLFQVSSNGGAGDYFFITSGGRVSVGDSTIDARFDISGDYSSSAFYTQIGGGIDFASDNVNALNIVTQLDAGTGFSARGIEVDNTVIADDGETLTAYSGLYISEPTITAAGTGSVDDVYGIYVQDFAGYTGIGAVNGDSFSARFDGYTFLNNNVGINISPSSANSLRVNVDDTTNATGLRITNQDVTNQPTSLLVEEANGYNVFAVSYDGIVNVGDDNVSNAELRIYDGDATANYVGLASRAALASNYTLTLPSTAPGVNECLKAGGTTATDLVFGSCGSGSSVWSLNGSDAYYNTGDVGIGTDSPQSPLHVLVSGTAGTPTINAVTSATFQRSGAASASNWVSIISGNTGVGRLNFGDTDSDNVGGLEYDHTLNNLVLRASGADVLTIASDRNHFFDNNGDHSLIVEARGSSAVGRSLTIGAGDSFSGGTAANGGVLNLQGGDALGTGNADGGQVAIDGGAGVGTGDDGHVVLQANGSGNVGINKLTPDATLDVFGNVLNVASFNSQAQFVVTAQNGEHYFTVDTESATDALAVKIGTGTDDVVLALDAFTTDPSGTVPNGAMFYDSDGHVFRCRINGSWANCDTTGGGGGGIVNRVNIFAEYAGGTLYADGSNNSGTMAANYDSTQRMNYYEWVATNGSLQDYDIIIHTAVPSDFSSANNTSWYINAYADNYNTAADNEISVAVYEGATQCNTTDNIVADTDLSANSTWAEVNLGSMASCTLNANDKLRIEIKMSSRSSNAVRVGDIRWDYNN